jgi:hypothetical protein
MATEVGIPRRRSYLVRAPTARSVASDARKRTITMSLEKPIRQPLREHHEKRQQFQRNETAIPGERSHLTGLEDFNAAGVGKSELRTRF